jgi:hypothetical protein
MISTAVIKLKNHLSNEKGSTVFEGDLTLSGYIKLVQELLILYQPLVTYEELI